MTTVRVEFTIGKEKDIASSLTWNQAKPGDPWFFHGGGYDGINCLQYKGNAFGAIKFLEACHKQAELHDCELIVDYVRL